MKDNDRLIWTSEINLEDWKEEFEYQQEEEGRCYEESEKWEWASFVNCEYLEDERMNLSEELPEAVVCLADLGLWDGRRKGCAIMDKNLNEVLRGHNDDDMEVYANRWNVEATGYHHDGTNYYTYRMFRPGLTDAQKAGFLSRWIDGKADGRDISRYTVSLLPYVAEVYGWKIDGRLKRKTERKEEKAA